MLRQDCSADGVPFFYPDPFPFPVGILWDALGMRMPSEPLGMPMDARIVSQRINCQQTKRDNR